MNKQDVISVSPPTLLKVDPSPLKALAVIIPEALIVPKLECNCVLIPGTAAVDIPLKLEPSPANEVAVITPAAII